MYGTIYNEKIIYPGNFIFFFFILIIPLEENLEEIENMEYENYIDLKIISPKKPMAPSLFFEIDNGHLIMVDSSDRNDLIISDNKGETWNEIDTGEFNNGVITRTRDIQAAYYDRDDDKIWFVDCDWASVFDVWYLDLTDYSMTSIGTSAGAVNAAYDIFKEGTDFFVMVDETVVATQSLRVYEVDTAPFTVEDTLDWSALRGPICLGVVVGTKYYTCGGSANNVWIVEYDDATTTITLRDNIINHNVGGEKYFGISYDGVDTLYFIIYDLGPDPYLATYSITGDVITAIAEQDMVFMLDRNTATQEKAFHATEYKVYQLHANFSHQLHLIAIPPTDAVIIGITDNFLINNDGDMFEFADMMKYIPSFFCKHQIQNDSRAICRVIKGSFEIEENLFMRFYDNFTNHDGTVANSIIFEGMIDYKDDLNLQTITLQSPSKKELENIFPEGDFAGRSDEIITSLLSTYNYYISKGTFSVGTAMGTITFGGNLSLEKILDGLVYFENWIWYLSPTGVLYFDDGTVDSTENFTEANAIYATKPKTFHEEYNKIKVRGAYIAGVQTESIWYENIASQTENGIKSKIISIPFLNTIALCNIAAANILTRLGKVPKKVSYKHQAKTLGLIQPGETVTFEFNRGGIIVGSDQFIISECIYNLQPIAKYSILDELP